MNQRVEVSKLKMESLIIDLDRCRFQNKCEDGNNIIPELAVNAIMSEQAVHDALQELEVPISRVDDTLQEILLGGRKVFAILLMIGHGNEIALFFEHDNMQKSQPDDRLPYDLASLERILPSANDNLIANKFFEKQWCLAIPFFSRRLLPRRLEKKTIFPFVHQKKIGSGSSGSVFEVQLHPQSHSLPLVDNKVRRQLGFSSRHIDQFGSGDSQRTIVRCR